MIVVALLLCALGQQRAVIVRVVDGDTILIRDLLVSKVAGPRGTFTTIFSGTVRLLDVSAPEPGEPGGAAATAWMRARLTADEPICLAGAGGDLRLDAFGRVLARVIDSDGDVGAGLVAAGLGRAGT